jgi:hypothetical protein
MIVLSVILLGVVDPNLFVQLTVMLLSDNISNGMAP